MTETLISEYPVGNNSLPKMVVNALAMRIHHIVSKDEFTKSLKDIIVFESDLVEFVSHQKVNTVFSYLTKVIS